MKRTSVAALLLVLSAGLAAGDELRDRLEALRKDAEPARAAAEKPALRPAALVPAAATAAAEVKPVQKPAEKAPAAEAPAAAAPVPAAAPAAAEVKPAEKPVEKAAAAEAVEKVPESPAQAAAVEAAQDGAVLASAVDAPVLSAYVWRGQVLNDETVFQPAVTLAKGGLSIGVWSSMNLTDCVTNNSMEFSEVDLMLSYGHRAGLLSLTVGIVEYLFPHSTLVIEPEDGSEGSSTAYPGTREVFVTATVPDWEVVPSVSVYRDIDEADSTYVTAGLASTRALGKTVDLSVGGSVGYADADYNAFYFSVDRAGWNDGNVSAALVWKAMEATTVTASIQYTILLDSDIKQGAAALYKDDRSLWGGVKISWSL
jgi:hypothetical protein